MPTLTIEGDYSNFTTQQCFSPDFTFSQQVDCHAQHLNVTHPPSTWGYDEYPFLWEPTICLLTNVTYSQRINVPDNFNWCFVPLSGSDAFLFVSLALIACGCLFGKLSAVWVLVAGGVVGVVNNYANLRHISNSITLWLGISPPDLFFYAFLPPLLVDSAIRIDFFMFSKLWVHCVLMAFVMVVLSALILTPLILYVLGFASRGFTWVHGALFAAMISSTDALAATAILKQGGGPEKLVVLMEGEALLNDASAITLFEVFLHLLADYSPSTGVPSVWGSIPVIIEDTLKLAGIGAGVGLAMSIATGYLLRWLRWRGAKPSVEITIILAVAYLSFYVGQSPAKGSGVISVVVFGLWGNFTSKWGMLSTAEESGSFDAFWDTLSFASNGLVFFWAGIASINYLIRSIDILGGQGWSYGAIPFIFIFMVLIRTGCMALFNLTAFRWIKERLSWAEVLFTGWAGLRGAISLILNADFIAHSAFLQGDKSNPDDPYRQLDQVNSDIAIWTSAFVLLTLMVNAPSVSTVMHWLRLDRISREKQAMRAKAKRALLRFTGAAIDTLRDDEEEFLQGANWEAVAAYVDISQALKKFDPPAENEPGKGDGLTTRKSLPQLLITPLRAPVDLALSPFMHKEAAASPAPAGREPSVRGRSATGGGGGLAAIGGMLRSISHRNLADNTDRSTRSRLGRRSSRGSHRERSRSRSRRGHTPGVRFSDTDSGGESDFEESDTESSSSLDSRWSGPSSAGPIVGEVIEECPFLQRPAQRRNSTEVEVPAEAPEAQGDIEMGLRPPLQQLSPALKQQQPQAAAAPSADAGVSAGQAAAIAALAASSPMQAPAAEAAPPAPAPAAATAAAAATAPQAAHAPPSPAPAAEEEEEMTAEELQFMRKVQERQRAQQQRRPTLGGLFSPPSDTETPSPHAVPSGSAASPFGLAAAGGAAAAMAGSTLRDSRRQGSTGALQTVTEHQQLVTGRESGRWHQQLEEPGSSAAGSDREGPDLYYSSMPANMGRQLQAQLQRQLHGDDAGRAQPAPATGAAAGGGAAPPAGGHARTSSGEELYYSSLPATAGRQLQAQLEQHLMVTPPHRLASGSHDAGGQPGASAPADSSAADSSPGASPATEQSPESPRASYYSSVPAALGRQLAEQLAAERAAATAAAAVTAGGATRTAAAQQGMQPESGTPESPRGSYYSSVPAVVGRQMAQQLAAERAAAAVASAAAPATVAAPAAPAVAQEGSPPPESPRGSYYSSVPAVVGPQMAQQLAAERAAAAAAGPRAGGPAGNAPRPALPPLPPLPPLPEQQTQEQAAQQDETEAVDASLAAAYYSSLPAAAGRSLQRQLAEQLAAARQQGEGQQQQQQQPTAVASQPPAAAAQAATAPSEVTADADFYSTMPAAVGRSMQRQLRQQLSAGRQPDSAQTASAGAAEAAAAFGRGPGRGPRQRQASGGSSMEQPSSQSLSQVPTAAAAAAAGLHAVRPARPQRMPPPAQRRPAWEDYHRTVTGAAGQNLQAELQRQLAARTSTSAAARAATATVAQAGRLSGMPQRDLLGRRIDRSSRHATTNSTAGSSSGEMPSLPLPVPGAPLGSTPAGAAAASVLPAATPLSAHLQLRRARTLHDRAARHGKSAGTAAELAGAGSLSARQPPRTREEVVALLSRGSAPRPLSAADTSWQHKPMRLERRTSHHHRHASASIASASIAAASEAGSQPTSPDYMAAAGGMAPATLLARTYSGPTVVAAITAASTGRKMQQRAALLQRISADALSRESSLHDGSTAAAALAAGLYGDVEGKPALEAISPFAQISRVPLTPVASGGMSEGALSEMRSRLIAGLKRYFHGKRMEGLLSVQGLRILEYACDHAAEHTNTPLGMWALLEKEVQGKIGTRITARCLLLLARSWRSAPRWLQTATNWPVTRVTGFLRRMLGRAMLVSCEVAVEYYLALIHSPQIQWLQQAEQAWPLQVEVDSEVDAAYRFIIDREIEAPDRFQAIQSYRAAMAVLRQQLTFVHELYESGMVDEGEKEDMLAPLDKRLRHLEITGPVWKPPRPRAVLRGLPFMQGLSDELFVALRQAGSIKEYKTGETFWSASDAVHSSGGLEGPGMYVVLSGVIRRVHHRPDGTKKEYFQGIGGVVGALLAWTGTRLPGGDSAVAEGNTLGKGPMLFHLPQSMVASLQAQHAAGDVGATQLRLHLMRLAGAYVVECCENDVVEAMQLHLVQLATAKLQRALRKRGGKHSSVLFSSTERPSSGGGDSGPGRHPLARESAKSDGQDDVEAPTSQPVQPLRPSATQARVQHGGAAEEEAEAVAAGRMTAKQQLLAQAAVSASGLRASKSIGAHLADLMQQIAQEEFEELGGDAAAGQKHLAQVEEGEEEPEGASPHASSYVAGDSTADLAAMADGADGSLHPTGGRSQPNGAAQHSPRSPRASRPDYFSSHGPSSSTDHGRHGRTAKLPRHRIRAAVRRAPQYALEVLADVKRCLPTSVVLELAPGAAWRQSTHAVLLRGSLAADTPADLEGMSGVASPRVSYSHRHTRSVEAGPSGAAPSAAAAGSATAAGAGSFLRRTSTTGDAEAAWEAALVAKAAAPQAPRVLPWLWCPRYHCNLNAAGRMPDSKRWVAGSEGALLLVSLTEAGELPAGVVEAEAEAAAARAAAELLASQQAAANNLRSHPLDVLAGGSGSGGITLPAGAAAAEAAGRSAAVEPLSARGPAESRPSGLRRLMPWQHRWQQPRSRPVAEPSGDRSGGESSAPGSSRGGGSQGDLLRLFSGSGGGQ